jgi:prolipoprotein diacylglyceryl transferase
VQPQPHGARLGTTAVITLTAIPASPGNHVVLGPLTIHYYALTAIAGILVGGWIIYVRWRARGGDPDLVFEVGLWAVLAGLVGGRVYFDITTPDQMGHQWYAPVAIWQGGLGIWGAVLFGAVAGAIVVRRRGASVGVFLDVAAPAILVGQAIGRLGNYFNQELFGGPTSLPWGLHVDPAFRPAHYAAFTSFQPTFLYEILWNVGLAGLLILIERRVRIRPPGLFALYVCLYCLGRIWWELMRVDPAQRILGERLNFWVALLGIIVGGVAFVVIQRRGDGTTHAAG